MERRGASYPGSTVEAPEVSMSTNSGWPKYLTEEAPLALTGPKVPLTSTTAWLAPLREPFMVATGK